MSGRCIEEDHLKTASKKSEFRSNEPWSENAFRSDEHKVKFYTGLPSFSILMIIYNFVSSQVRYGSKMHALSKFEEFIATIMKLRLGILIKILHTGLACIKQQFPEISEGGSTLCLLD